MLKCYMSFSIDNVEGVASCNNPPSLGLGKYVWKNCSGELGLDAKTDLLCKTY